MNAALREHHSVTGILLWVLGTVVVVAVVAAVIGHLLTRRGHREPVIVRMINRASERVVDTIRRPITVAVLDEVAEVLQTGHYTKNMAAALQENHDELKQMMLEKLEHDRMTGYIGFLPFHERVINELTETMLRVLLEVLADPRTDELVSDVLRDNVTQIRAAVRRRQAEAAGR